MVIPHLYVNYIRPWSPRILFFLRRSPHVLGISLTNPAVGLALASVSLFTISLTPPDLLEP